MAGTIFGLPLSQQFDADTQGFLSGGLLYLYEAGTTTPVTAYEDFGLSIELPHPIPLDAAGRIPEFWLEDGSYRVVLRNVAGVTQFDVNSTTALGASSGSGGGGGGESVSDAAIFTTGDVKWKLKNGTESGWVRMNGRTIGSASSGATERANADAEALFLYLWNNLSNTIAAVSGGGRGASASADWNANKTIVVPSMQGRSPYGLDDMGTTAAGVLTAGSPTTLGATLGAEKTTLAEANLPGHTHSSGTLAASAHTHDGGTLAVASHTHAAGSFAVGTSITNGTLVLRDKATSSNISGGGAQVVVNDNTEEVTISLASGAVSGTSGATAPSLSGATASATPTISGATASTGSGTAATTVGPGRLGTWYTRL